MARPRRPSLRSLKRECAELAKVATRIAKHIESYEDDLRELVLGAGPLVPGPKPTSKTERKRKKAGRPKGSKNKPKTPQDRRRTSTTTMIDGQTMSEWVHAKCPPGRPIFLKMLVTEAEEKGATTRMLGGFSRLIRQIIGKSNTLEWVDEGRTRFKHKEG